MVVVKRKSAPKVSRAAPVVSSFITEAGGTTWSERCSSITAPVVIFSTSTLIFALPVIGCSVSSVTDNNIEINPNIIRKSAQSYAKYMRYATPPAFSLRKELPHSP